MMLWPKPFIPVFDLIEMASSDKIRSGHHGVHVADGGGYRSTYIEKFGFDFGNLAWASTCWPMATRRCATRIANLGVTAGLSWAWQCWPLRALATPDHSVHGRQRC